MKVIIALADKKRDHIPYRQSKLTHLLKDSLGKHNAVYIYIIIYNIYIIIYIYIYIYYNI